MWVQWDFWTELNAYLFSISVPLKFILFIRNKLQILHSVPFKISWIWYWCERRRGEESLGRIYRFCFVCMDLVMAVLHIVPRRQYFIQQNENGIKENILCVLLPETVAYNCKKTSCQKVPKRCATCVNRVR